MRTVPLRRLASARVGTLAGVVLVGGVVGFVGNDAREQAVARSEVEVVLGSAGIANAEPGWFELSLRNTGARAVDVVDVAMPGFSRVGSDAAVTAEPDDWTDVTLPLEPECTTEPTGAVRVDVRTDDGADTTVHGRLSPGAMDYPALLWRSRCDTARGLGLQTREPTTLTGRPDRLDAAVPVVNDGDGPVLITDVTSTTPGLTVAVNRLGPAFGPGESTTLDLTWSVRECTEASEMETISAQLDVGMENTDVTRQVEARFSPAVLFELARLTERACGTQELP